MTKKKTIKKPVRVIPEYRQQIDVSKLCRALLMAAKESPPRSDQSEDKDGNGLEKQVDISPGQS